MMEKKINMLRRTIISNTTLVIILIILTSHQPHQIIASRSPHTSHKKRSISGVSGPLYQTEDHIHAIPDTYLTLGDRDRKEAEGLIRETVLEEDLEELRKDNTTLYPTLESSWKFYKRASFNNLPKSNSKTNENPVNEDGGEWSACSFSCGIGISHRLRSCRPTDINCRRFMVEYKLCNTQPCPKSGQPQDLDFRYHQCKSFDETPYRGRLFKWVPFENVRNPCSLTCKAENYNFVVVFSPKALDGTRCTNNSQDVCINGKCRTVGCDFKLGSTKKLDSCGVCGGDNSQCQRNFYYWQETEYSACSASCGGGYQMTSSFCRMMRPSKVVPSYFCEPKSRPAPKIKTCAQQDCPPKWFTDDWGPCPKKCGFSKQSRNVYCAQELKNKSLITVNDKQCHGPKPEQQKQCQLKKCPYWKTGFWSPCTVTCGNGIKMLELKCIGPEGGLSDECEEKDKPSHIQACSTNVTCPEEKYIDEDRIILTNSLAKDAPNKLSNNLPDDKLRSLNKATHDNIDKNDITLPQATYSPNLLYLFRPDFRYVVSDWGECSEACGKEGFRARSVKCKVYYPYTQIMVEVPEDQCRGVFKPPAKESCNQRNCQKDGPNIFETTAEDQDDQSKTDEDVKAFEGDLPLSAASTTTQDSFIWKYRGFSDCSAKCLGGIQDSVILCVRENNGKVFDDNHCDLSRKPPPFQRTCNEFACPPRWEVSSYSSCSHSCGGGIQTRSVRCLHQTAKGKANIYVVPPEMCPEPRPESKNSCNNVDCSPFWAMGNWSGCSKNCEGMGIQRRPIYCQQVTAKGHVAYLVDESSCVAGAEKPPFIRECKPDLSPTEVANCANSIVPSAPFWQSPQASNSIMTHHNNKFSPWDSPFSSFNKVSEPNQENVDFNHTPTPLGLTGTSERQDAVGQYKERQQNDGVPVPGINKWATAKNRTNLNVRPSKGRGKGRFNKLRKMMVRVKSQKSHIMVPKGTFLKMKCNFKKELLKTPITWTKNGVTIIPMTAINGKNTNASRINISKYGALKIKNIRVKDTGKYECLLGDQFKKMVIVKVIPPRKDWSRPFKVNSSASPGRSPTISAWPELQQKDEASLANIIYEENMKSLSDDSDQEALIENKITLYSTNKPRQPWNVDSKLTNKGERDVLPTNLRRYISVLGADNQPDARYLQRATNTSALQPDAASNVIKTGKLPDDYENFFIDSFSSSSLPTSVTRYAVALPKFINNESTQVRNFQNVVTKGSQRIYYITKPFSAAPANQNIITEIQFSTNQPNNPRNVITKVKITEEKPMVVEPELLYWQSYGWTKCSQTCGGRGIQIQVSLCHLKLSWKTPNNNDKKKNLNRRLMQRYTNYAKKAEDPYENHKIFNNKVDKAKRSLIETNKRSDEPLRNLQLNEFTLYDESPGFVVGPHYKIVDDNYCQKIGLKRPPKFRRCGNGECPKWRADPWQQCKASPCESLNVAVQERRVYCAYSNGSLASRSSYDSPGCRMIERPPMRKECYNDKCKAMWITSNWSPCSKSCGHGGIITRVIHCAWINTTKSAGSHCINQPRPETVKICENIQCPSGKEEKECQDHSMYCGVTLRLNLCDVGDYKIRCCKTCSDVSL